MLARTRKRQAGDTLIEVLFAITVFSLVVVTSLTIMNKGTQASTRSLQITLVRQEMDSQAEALRFLNSAYVAAYFSGYNPNVTDSDRPPAEEYFKIVRDVKAKGASSVTKFGGGGSATCQTPPAGSFILNTRTAQYQAYSASKIGAADVLAEVGYNADSTISSSKGLWVEAVRSTPSSGTAYTDFHIRACWYAPGLDQPMNLGTIVRLYEPAT